MKTDQMNIIMTVIVIRTDTASRGLQRTSQMLFFFFPFFYFIFFLVLNKRLTFCCCDIEVMPGPPATTETSVTAAPNGFIPFHAGTNLSVKHSSLPVPNQQSRLDTFYSTGPF